MYRNRLAFALAMAALAAILVPSSLPAQITFQRTYGGGGDDGAYSVQQTADGGYIVAGFTSSYGAGNDDVYLIRTDARGDTMWTRTFGGAAEDIGYSVQQTADSGYIIAGYAKSFGGENVYLIKTNSSGDTMWAKTYGGTSWDDGYSVQQTTDGGYVIAGGTCSYGAGDYDVYLIKTDACGDTMWTREFGGWQEDIGYAVQQTNDGGYIIAGETYSFGAGDESVYLIKTDGNGDTMWTKTYGNTPVNLAYSVQQVADGGYIVAGYTHRIGAADADIYLIRTKANGDTVWTRTLGGMEDDYGNSVRQTADGGYIIAADEGFWSSAYLIKTDAEGDPLWTKNYSIADYGESVQQTADGGYVLAGSCTDVCLIKTDSLGRVAVAEPKANPTRAPALSLSCSPNPCRSSTVLHLTTVPLDHSTTLLRIFDAQGRLVRFFSSLLSPISSLTWNGTDDFGKPLPS